MATRLHYADTSIPSITRRFRRGKRAYFASDGSQITDRNEIARLDAIALPPAYTDAWYASDPASHILATGVDARGRKQYRYHPEFTALRDARKFEACAEFGHLLPRIRSRVEKDLAKRGLTEERATASVVRLLDTGRLRIGNEHYASENRSFGASTLRRRHARLEGRRLTLRFKAKSGRLCTFSVTDRGLIRFVKQVQELPGQHLFQYLDEEDQAFPITSSHVNAYIRETMGGDFSAKDFRTWSASVLAMEWLIDNPECDTLKEMVAYVASHLGNTPAMARKSYIHPALINLVASNGAERSEINLSRKSKWMSSYERTFLYFLKKFRHYEMLKFLLSRS